MKKLSSILTFQKLSIFLAIISLFVVGAASGYQFAVTGHRITKGENAQVVVSRENPEGQTASFTQFWQVWDLLKKEYYDPSKVIDGKMVLGAIKGMVAAVGDPYTVFLSKDEQKVTSEDLSGKFPGVGIQIGYKGTDLAVIAPLPNSPAEKAGIQAGDLIVAVKDDAKNIDKSTDGMSLPEAVQIIRGPAGSKVTLALLREDSTKPIVVEVERQVIDVPSVALKFEGESADIAHIKLLKFGAETKVEWDRAVMEILGKPDVKGIIIDVRNNPGGYLQSAADIATDFLEKGSIVVTEEAVGDLKDEVRTETQGRLIGTPVIVLINKGSASASEILSGALRDQKSYKLVGTTSFGKGTVQEPREFPDGTGIHITIWKWLTPRGTWVHGKGLEPDVVMEDNPETEVDEQLQKAVEMFK